MQRDNAYWKKKLGAREYHILREKGTEPPWSGEFVNKKEDGTYVCRACSTPLFSSATKYESGTGWPSFYDVIDSNNVTLKKDSGFFGSRVEVLCSNCGGHLGHVFPDGPQPTGERYCINSLALGFHPEAN